MYLVKFTSAYKKSYKLMRNVGSTSHFWMKW